jgi:hypothetical protein
MSVSIVWLDHELAKIYHFSDDRMERDSLHLKSGQSESYDTLAGSLSGSKQVLILSPGEPGKEFFRRILGRFPDLSKRVVGCETLSKADDAAVAEYAVKYFRKPVVKVV